MYMLYFALGLTTGCFLGITIMCICNIAHESNLKNKEMEKIKNEKKKYSSNN